MPKIIKHKKNEQFSSMLEELHKNPKLDEKERNAALDALLAVDLSKIDEVAGFEDEHGEVINNEDGITPYVCKQFHSDFKIAVDKHREFWQQCDEEIFKDIILDDENWILDDGDDIDEAYQYKALKQQAAEQRVKFGLKNASQQTLIDILSNNTEECRAYLADKPEFGKLKNKPGWVKDVTPAAVPAGQPTPKAKNTGQDILDDAAIQKIKDQAVLEFVRTLINKSENQEKLKTLLKANNIAEIKNALNGIGTPTEQTVIALLKNEDLATILESFDGEYLEGVIETRLGELTLLNDFPKYVKDLPTDKILEKQEALEGDLQDDFVSFLINEFEFHAYPDVDKVKEARGILGARYLEVHLPAEVGFDKLATVANAADPNAMIALVKAVDGFKHEYVDDAITLRTIDSIRFSMIQAFLTGIGLSKLDPLINEKNITRFKELLKAHGFTKLEWMTPSHMEEVQRTACELRFPSVIKENSPLVDKTQPDSSLHPALIEALKQAPVDKQLQIMRNKEELRQLLQSEDPRILKHFLGDIKPTTLIDDLVEENIRLAKFKEISNSALATMLANFKPAIELTPDMILKINSEIRTHGVGVLDENLRAHHSMSEMEMNIGVHYQTMIDKLKPLVIPELRVALDTALVSNKEAILNQQRSNLNLFYEYRAVVTTLDYRLLEVVRSIKKDGYVFITLPNLKQALGKATSVSDFVNKLEDEMNLGKIGPRIKLSNDFKTNLIRDLSTTVFIGLKRDMANTDLSSDDKAVVAPAIKQMNAQIKTLHDSTAVFTKHNEKFELLGKIIPIHLFNPSFQGKAKAEARSMRAEYQQLGKDCDLVVNQLRRSKQFLVSYFHSLPEEEDNKKDGKIINPDIEKLRKKIREEIMEVNDNLKIYQQAKNTIPVILKAIDDAEKGAQNYNYVGTGKASIDMTPHKIGEPLPAIGVGAPVSAAAGPVAAATPDPTGATTLRTRLNFDLVDKPKEGMLKAFVVTNVGATSGKPIVGRFLEQHSQLNVPATVTSRAGELTKPSQGKFTVDTFPKHAGPKPASVSEKDWAADLATARVNFSMAMAAQILASLDEPPTKDKPLRLTGEKEEELKYLWTALLVLGEKTPHMKFNSDAIVVNSSTFNPASQKGRVYGYDKDSLHETVFKDKDKNNIPAVTQKLTGLAEVTKEKFDTTTAEAMKKVLESGRALHQSKVGKEEVLKVAEKAQKEEGIVLEPPAPSIPGSGSGT
jgi:hypothetical protein